MVIVSALNIEGAVVMKSSSFVLCHRTYINPDPPEIGWHCKNGSLQSVHCRRTSMY